MNKTSQYSIEIQYKVRDNENQQFIQVAPDAAGFGCVEVAYIKGGIVDRTDRITMPPEMALLVADAIKRIAEHMIEQNG